MYCKKCGKEIENDSIFCAYCGCEQKSGKAPQKQGILEENQQKKYQTKEFDFGYFDDNARAIKKINKWLVDKSISFIGIHIDTQFIYFPFAETSMRHVTIVYEEIEETDYRYQIGVEAYANILFENSYKKVKKQFDRWKANNQDKTVVWETIKGHEYLYNNWVSNVTSLYYIFREKRDEAVYRKRMKALERDISRRNSIMLLFGVLFIGFFWAVISRF